MNGMTELAIPSLSLFFAIVFGLVSTAQAEPEPIFQKETVECVFHPNSSKRSGRLPAQIAKHEYDKRYALFRGRKADFVRQYGNILIPRGAALVVEFENDSCEKHCLFEILITRRLEYQSRIDCRIEE